jgi:spore coat protein A, manganese oxidase
LQLYLSSFATLAEVKAQIPDASDASSIPKFVNQLTSAPPVYVPKIIKNPNGKGIAYEYTVYMSKSMQQVLPAGYPQTPVWGYGGNAKDSVTGKSLGYVLNSPGPSFEAIRGIPIVVKYVNNITSPYMFTVDPTLHWADPTNPTLGTMRMWNTFPATTPGIFKNIMDGMTIATLNAQTPVPLVPHLHGGEVSSLYDGGPTAWWTNGGLQGLTYNTLKPTSSNAAVYYYPNEQPATTLWYHDHALGLTRINVMSGLAGFYLLRDPKDLLGYTLPSGAYEVPLAIQDRTFNPDGSFNFPDDQATNPDVHPYWSPEFFGDTIMVNGLVWPNMDVSRTSYRFRLLDGSNARFYTLSLVTNTGAVVPFTQIGTDGGYMKSAVKLTELTIAPGERADIVVDFSGLPAGTKILMKNTANTPYPDGDTVDANTAQIMQFTVTSKSVPLVQKLKNAVTQAVTKSGITLNYNLKATLPTPIRTRYLTLYEVASDTGPLEVLVNGQKWGADISENVTQGTTEEWVIVNLTMDTHPIHTHLTQFQLVSRTPIDTAAYNETWVSLENNKVPPYGPGDPIPTELPIAGFTTGPSVGPAPNEYAWKDTIQMNPGEAITIRLRFSPIDGTANYPFDPTVGPGYVWHCHIIDHEDNEMMRPYLVIK